MLLGVPSLEFMQFQNDDFFDKLTTCITNIRQDEKLTTKTVFQSGIEEVIFDRLKMRVEIRIIDDPQPNASIGIPAIDKNHVFVRAFSEYSNDDYGKMISYFDKASDRVGTIDIDKLTVGGVFSNIPIYLAIHSGHFNEIFTDREIASTILHELGHGWTYFYYLLHATLCSFISAATATAIVGAKGDKERIVILQRGLRVMGIDGVAVSELLTQTPEQISASMQTLYINSTSSNLRSATGYGMYEIRAAEQLADWFAVCFGAGLEAATCQEKLYKSSRQITLNNSFKTRASIYSAIAYGALYLSVAIPFPTIFSEVFRDDTISLYDNDDDRIKLMRQGLISQIKDVKLPAMVRKDLLKQIDEMKEVENRVHKDVQKEYSFVTRFLKKHLARGYRQNVKAVELQKTIEEMFFNESYVMAAKFQGVSK